MPCYEKEKEKNFRDFPENLIIFLLLKPATHGHRTICLGGQLKASLFTCPSCHSYLPTKERHTLCCSRETNTFADYKITPVTVTGDTEFSGRKADSVRKALRQGLSSGSETELDHQFVPYPLPVEGEAGIKVRVQLLTDRKTKQAARRVISGFMSYASIPATEVKFIPSCEALGCRRRQYQCS